MTPLQSIGVDQIAETAAKAVSSARHGFVLDRPTGFRHRNNLPFTWPFPSVVFGLEPGEVVCTDGGVTAEETMASIRRTEQCVEAGNCALAVGFISYDLGGFLEPTAASKHPPDPLPLVEFCLYERYYAWEERSGRLLVCTRDGQREASTHETDEILQYASRADAGAEGTASALGSNFSRDAYIRAVEDAREYILDGDIFEVNISQRFQADFTGSPWQLYLRLRRYNPAPYAALLVRPGAAVLSSSPELFLRIEGDAIVTRPIKGTISRRAGAIADRGAAAALAASEKDNAELAMIIDLERNDLGRVCRYGSVKVRERARVETFSRVHHLVSTVEGRLQQGMGLSDVIAATFPGGSITGAPKVRAMQIIDELEPCRRGVYTGSIGCLTPGGRVELNIAIRTMIQRGSAVWLQVGGAVTADSKPAAEYDETVAKALAMFEALGIEERAGKDGHRDG